MTTRSDTTTNAVWIVGDLRTRRLWRQSLKVMTKARSLAEQAGAPVTMLLLGATNRSDAESRTIDLSACVSMAHAAREAVAFGANTVYCIDHPRLAIPRSDTYARVLADLVDAEHPWLILTALTDFGRETAAFCAQRCRAGLIADCGELVFKDRQVVGRCPAWGGQVLADITLAPGWPTAFVTVHPQGVLLDAEGSGNGRIETIVPDRIDMPQGMQLLACAMAPAAARRLEQADIVVAGGAGLGDMRGFGLVRELAAALGGEVGATRPPVMNHWVEEQRLIGQTGKRVRPRLLISAGTSGAIQYTAGIMEADTIVAINRDEAAPIFNIADIGLVGEAGTLLPLMTRQANQTAMRRLADAVCPIDGQLDRPQRGFGAMVRQLREARNWSIDELAGKTGQTPDFVAQVEADQLSPPVAFMLRMAQVMEVDPGTFLSKKEQAAIRDRRAQAYHQRTRNYNYTTLTPDAENSHLHAFMVTIAPYLAHKPVAYKHDGEEFIFVMSGELAFTLGTTVHVLKTGESIHFNADVPHKLKNLSSDVTRCLVVLYTI